MGKQGIITRAKTGYTCQQVLDMVNGLAISFWQAQGYAADGSGLVGKKAGKDNHDAQKTTSWAKIKIAPDGTEYFYSLSNSPAFANWENAWAAAGLPDAYIDEEMPALWLPVIDENIV